MPEPRHAQKWQPVLENRPAGSAIRALGWLGPENADAVLKILKGRLSSADFSELVTAAPQLPTWFAQAIGKAPFDCRAIRNPSNLIADAKALLRDRKCDLRRAAKWLYQVT
ncbi:hypothetical protein [Mesorhizobium sp. 8]|uniref:hypothetical protein n=1 Tax=Mesorhizobium sp. 8 TaxID=2584466 RepID=UPI0011227620|nr:hypothetical protein [Mesorhizobium sp. 8]QDC02802.1 hypothetical protein FGU64_21705 [Mesorhizobium sp. 8]